MKVGDAVSFKFAGASETGVIESKSIKSGRYLVRGTHCGFLYPLDKKDLTKHKK